MSSIILTDLNPEQQAAVSYTDGPLLVLAGAGSGKTKVLTYRAVWFIKDQGLDPHSIFLLTFTNKAAAEMRTRITTLLDSNYSIGFAGTFHSFCVRLLRVDGKAIGIDPNFLIYDQDDQKELIKEILLDLNLSDDSYVPSNIANMISDAKSRMITPLQYAEIAQGDMQEQVFKIYSAYEKLLSKANAVDFDDLLLKSVQLLSTSPSVLDKWQKSIAHLLVDEWQDTNKIQYMLTKLLVGKNNNLTAVGDASQSIYSWRGADYRNINYLSKDYPNLKVINLERNYRSTQNILDAANLVISQNSSHPILKLWTDKSGGERLKIYKAQNGLEEASFIVQEIQTLKRHGYNFSDIAILYRTNAQSRVLEEALLHSGIPYTLVGGTKFYDRKEIRDVLSYLRLLANPKDSVSERRVEKLGKRRLEKFTILRTEITDIDQFTTLEILDQVLQKTNYTDAYKRESEENLTRLENIKELRSVAAQFPKLLEFLENVSLVEAENKNHANDSKDCVTLMTLHAAKGLEFTVVFLAGMEEGMFPHSRSLFDPTQLEEERRLAYVGITRAKEVLYLTYAARRLYFGQNLSNPPSRFLIDIPEHLIENLSANIWESQRQKEWTFDDNNDFEEDNYNDKF